MEEPVVEEEHKNCCKRIWQKWLQVWRAPAGPKTIFFWAPLVKWGMVLANVADLWRPAELLSIWQALALTFTGFIWARYSTVIYPINWLLFSVNLFVGVSSLTQLGRIFHYWLVGGGEDKVTTAIITTLITNVTGSISTPNP